jgi:hypothetical protein
MCVIRIFYDMPSARKIESPSWTMTELVYTVPCAADLLLNKWGKMIRNSSKLLIWCFAARADGSGSSGSRRCAVCQPRCCAAFVLMYESSRNLSMSCTVSSKRTYRRSNSFRLTPLLPVPWLCHTSPHAVCNRIFPTHIRRK